MSSDRTEEQIQHLNRRLTTLIGYQFIAFGMLGFLVLSDLGEASRGADVFMIAVALGLLYHMSDQIYSAYRRITELVA